jgi:SAM-dependent methyltransferase
LYKFIGPGKSLVDIGAGVGQMKVALDRMGADVDYTGFDGGSNIMELEGTHAPVVNDPHHIIPHLCWVDASKPFNLGRTFDVVLSKEVGEHIPPEGEQAFMDNLVRLARPDGGIIVLTWSPPGRGGFGHVNCREKSYIIKEMEKRGVKFEADMTSTLGSKIARAYADNLTVYSRNQQGQQHGACPFIPPGKGTEGGIARWGGWEYDLPSIQ